VNKLQTIGLGGGCHWCTEAVFSTLKGITKVQQGWLKSKPPADTFSEGVLVDFDADILSLEDLITVHLETHASQSNHSMREKYRSAIYVKQSEHDGVIQKLLKQQDNIVTAVLPLCGFKLQDNKKYVNYYFNDPDKPFCQAYISPKLKQLYKKHQKLIKPDCL